MELDCQNCTGKLVHPYSLTIRNIEKKKTLFLKIIQFLDSIAEIQFSVTVLKPSSKYTEIDLLLLALLQSSDKQSEASRQENRHLVNVDATQKQMEWQLKKKKNRNTQKKANLKSVPSDEKDSLCDGNDVNPASSQWRWRLFFLYLAFH